MAIYEFVEIGLEEVKTLSGLAGVKCDLESVIQLSKLLIEQINTLGFNPILIEAITTAILIRYARPFTTGKRSVRLNIDDIDGLDDDDKNRHKKIIEMRNKYIAHSVNCFEENKVVGYYISGEDKISQIAIQSGRVVTFSPENIAAIVALSEKILNHVTNMIEKEKLRVLEVAKCYDVEELSKMTKQSSFKPDISKPNKERRW